MNSITFAISALLITVDPNLWLLSSLVFFDDTNRPEMVIDLVFSRFWIHSADEDRIRLGYNFCTRSAATAAS